MIFDMSKCGAFHQHDKDSLCFTLVSLRVTFCLYWQWCKGTCDSSPDSLPGLSLVYFLIVLHLFSDVSIIKVNIKVCFWYPNQIMCCWQIRKVDFFFHVSKLQVLITQKEHKAGAELFLAQTVDSHSLGKLERPCFSFITSIKPPI